MLLIIYVFKGILGIIFGTLLTCMTLNIIRKYITYHIQFMIQSFAPPVQSFVNKKQSEILKELKILNARYVQNNQEVYFEDKRCQKRGQKNIKCKNSIFGTLFF
jgi:hypothetical protein